MEETKQAGGAGEEGYHPSMGKFAADRERTLGNMVHPWDGKQVWAQMDGIWRQATVLSACPSRDPKGTWSFIIDTKHDEWRSLITGQAPTDEHSLAFECLQITEYALLPGTESPYQEIVEPSYFEILPADSPQVPVKDGVVPVHPFIAAELRAMRNLNEKLRADADQARKDLGTKTVECAARAKNEEKLEKTLRKEKDERVMKEDKLNAKIDEREKEIVTIKGEKLELANRADTLKTMVNQLQAETNSLNAVVVKHNNDAVKAREAIVVLQTDNKALDVMVKGLQDEQTTIKHDTGILEEENRVLRDRIQALDEALQKTIEAANQSAHESAIKWAVERASATSEIERLREQIAGVPAHTTEASRAASASATVDADHRLWAVERESNLAENRRLSDLVAQLQQQINATPPPLPSSTPPSSVPQAAMAGGGEAVAKRASTNFPSDAELRKWAEERKSLVEENDKLRAMLLLPANRAAAASPSSASGGVSVEEATHKWNLERSSLLAEIDGLKAAARAASTSQEQTPSGSVVLCSMPSFGGDGSSQGISVADMQAFQRQWDAERLQLQADNDRLREMMMNSSGSSVSITSITPPAPTASSASAYSPLPTNDDVDLRAWNKTLQVELAQVKAQQEKDRDRWSAERDRMRDEIARLRAELAAVPPPAPLGGGSVSSSASAPSSQDATTFARERGIWQAEKESMLVEIDDLKARLFSANPTSSAAYSPLPASDSSSSSAAPADSGFWLDFGLGGILGGTSSASDGFAAERASLLAEIEVLKTDLRNANLSANPSTQKLAAITSADEVQKRNMSAELTGLRVQVETLQQNLAATQAAAQAGGAPAPMIADDSELRKNYVVACSLNDHNKEIVEHAFEEIDRLNRMMREYETKGKELDNLVVQVEVLRDQLAALQTTHSMPVTVNKGESLLEVAGVTAETEEQTQYALEDDEETRARKKREKAERKALRQRIRAMQVISVEVDSLKKKTAQLEKQLEVEGKVRPPPPPSSAAARGSKAAGGAAAAGGKGKAGGAAAPGAAATPAKSSAAVETCCSGSCVKPGSAVVTVNKSEYSSLKLQLAAAYKLISSNGSSDGASAVSNPEELVRLLKLSSEEDIATLTDLVNYLKQRVLDLEALYGKEGKPKGVSVGCCGGGGGGGGKAADTKHPWTVTQKIDSLEKENKMLNEEVAALDPNKVAAEKAEKDRKIADLEQEKLVLTEELTDANKKIEEAKAKQGGGLLGIF